MNSLIQLFDSYGVQYRDSSHHHVRKGWIGVDCPFCSPGWNKFRLGFEVNSGRVNCWNCGRIKPTQALELLLRVDASTAQSVWSSVPRTGYFEDRVERKGILKIPPGVKEMVSQHENYLKGRGFDVEVLKHLWEIKGIGFDSVNLKWRIFIPIHDITGKVVSWTTRSIGKHELRYISASEDEEAVPHKSLLYGAHLAQHVIFIHEGPFDAWAVGPGGVATCGVGCTEIQIALMTAYPIRVVCFDSTPDAQRRAERLCSELATYPGTTENIELESGEDPASADPAELKEMREKFLIS